MRSFWKIVNYDALQYTAKGCRSNACDRRKTATDGDNNNGGTSTRRKRKAHRNGVCGQCTEVAGEIIAETEKDTVECIDEGDQSLAAYKPQIGGQPNPFENDTPTEIDDRPVEDYIGEGEGRPGEGTHF